jgi:hypothetical protein
MQHLNRSFRPGDADVYVGFLSLIRKFWVELRSRQPGWNTPLLP